MTTTGTELREPIPVPEPEGPPIRELDLRRWARENLFSTRFNAVLTIVFAVLLALVVYRVGRFVLVDARWEIIERNIKNFLVFHFPDDELWRLWAAMFVLAASVGFGVGLAGT